MTTLYMETTKKSPEQTAGEIQQCLKRYGLVRLVYAYGDDREIAGMMFSIKVRGREIPYRLPIDHVPLMNLAKRTKLKYLKPGDEVQARRVAWRQVLRWVEAQLALVDVGMVSIDQVFLAYQWNPIEEKTAYQYLLENFSQQLPERNEP